VGLSRVVPAGVHDPDRPGDRDRRSHPPRWTPPVADDPRAGPNGGARPRGLLTRSPLGTATTLAPANGLRARTVGGDAEPDTGTGMLTAAVIPLTTLGRPRAGAPFPAVDDRVHTTAAAPAVASGTVRDGVTRASSAEYPVTWTAAHSQPI
jgi:hypothetical protein